MNTLFDPPIPPVDPNVNPIDAPRLSRQAETILGLLRDGPKLNTELAAVSHRFGGRIHDLRRAGFKIVTVPLADGTGRVTYRLVP